MRTISREEFPEEGKENQQVEKTKQENLTPWQLANMEYLKQKALEKGETVDQAATAEETNELSNTDGLAEEKLEEPEQKDTIPLESETEEPEMEDAPSGPKNGSFLERLPNIKHERNRRLVKRSLILIGLFSIPALLLLYYISPLAKLGGVSIKGNEKI